MGRIIAGFVNAAALSAGWANSAAAATGVSGDFCVHQDAEYSTANGWYTFRAADDFWLHDAPPINGNDGSWRDYWTTPVWLYDYSGYSGIQTACLAPGQGVANYGPVGHRGSSHRAPGTTGCR